MPKKQTKTRRYPQFLARPLLVKDEASAQFHFLARRDVPPDQACLFFAQEPFTVLSISPGLPAAEIADQARIQSQRWKETVSRSDQPYWENLVHIIDQAEEILCNQCVQYRAFVKKYKSLGRCYSKSRIQKTFFTMLTRSAPGLKKRQTLKNLKVGGIFSIPLLISITFLVVVLTLPLGGITILGYVLFAKTLFAAWGPLAFIPSFALVAIGGFGSYWYRRHKHVFQELSRHFRRNLKILEALAFAVEDYYLLQAFHLKLSEPESFRVNQRAIKKTIVAQMNAIVFGFLQAFIRNVAEFTEQHANADRMDIAEFYQLLEEHPGELEKCSEAALIRRLTVDVKTMLPVVE